ncbi:MAG: hypothetical protein Q4G27_10290 [Flavobacteriaceae bacterium]|nr:hypothetical protein [Flavobacteriaceae bacterium]
MIKIKHKELYTRKLGFIFVLLFSFTTTFSQNLISSCPSGVADLTTQLKATQPNSLAVTFHTSNPATDANKVTDPTAVTQGTYYAAFYDTTGAGCYSPVSNPIYVSKCMTNVCPSTNVDLSGIVDQSGNNGNGTLEWHTSATPSPATKVTDITAVGAGTYWAVFYDAAEGGCYSPVSNPVDVNIDDCIECTAIPTLTGTALPTEVGITTLDRNVDGNWVTDANSGFVKLESKTLGFVPTRLTSEERNRLNAEEGMLIWNKTTECMEFFDGNAWVCSKNKCQP